MKSFKYILLLPLVIILIVIVAHKKETGDVSPSPTGEVAHMCYIWNTEAGDSATLRMDITDGTNITGSFDYLPAEKDKKTGPIVGTAGSVDPKTMARKAMLQWTASAEGMTNQEELSILFGEGTANPGFGEMKDDGGGMYVYAHPDQVDYSLTLAQTDCSDPAAL